MTPAPWEISANAEPHRRHRLEPPGPFPLEHGAVLPRIRIACETWGEPDPPENPANAVLICPALSADAHAAGPGGGPESAVDGFGAGETHAADPGLGWWDPMIGPDKAFDTKRFYVICMSLLGGCGGATGPPSRNPSTGRRFGRDFPVITVGDIARASRAGLRELGVRRLAGIAGGSLGGMQALEWAAAFPDEVEAVVGVATTAGLSAQGIGWNWVAREAIAGDLSQREGRRGESDAGPSGLRVARMVGHLTYLSAQGMAERFGRDLQDQDEASGDLRAADFAVESYLRHQADKFVRRFDPDAYLRLSHALTRFDLARRHGGGALEAAAAKFRCRTLLLSFTSDWLYPSADSRRLAAALQSCGKPVVHEEIRTTYGHDSFLLEARRMTPIIRSFLMGAEGAR